MHQMLSPSPTFVGREREVACVKNIALGRSGVERSIVITGERGSGKTSLLQAATAGLDCELLWFRGDSFSGVEPWAAMLNGLRVLSTLESFAGVLDDVNRAVAETVDGGLEVSQLGRRLVDMLRLLPRGERAMVVAFEDVHLCDAQSLELLGYLAHRSYLFDVSYLVTGVSERLPSFFDDLPRVHLKGLEPAQLTQALTAWSGVDVDPSVGAALTEASAGNPSVAAELMATLDPEQLAGDAALPPLLPVTETVTQLTSPLLESVSKAELELLACFAHGNDVPNEVVRRLSTAEVIGELLRRRLIKNGSATFRATRAGLGAAAVQRLAPDDLADLYSRLCAAWEPASQLRSVLYLCWSGHLDADCPAAAQGLLGRLDPQADPRLVEALAEQLAAAPAEQQRAGDWIAVLQVRARARHLPGAVAAFWRAWRAVRCTEDDLVILMRWRWILSQLTGDPALALPTATELSRLSGLKSQHTFEGLVLAARSAVTLGATEQARRLLDQAHQLSRAARLMDRALWRVVHAELLNRTGQPVRPEATRELVTRWCDLTERDSWYDDVLAIRALIDAEAYENAAQLLLTAEGAYATAGGYAAVFLLTVRLELELATFDLSSARSTAEQLRTIPTGAVVHLHGLGANLIRTEALTGLADGTFGHLRERACRSDKLRLTRELGHRHLIAGRYADAAVLLESALRDDQTLTEAQRWEVLADLVEAQVATGQRSAAEDVLRSASASSASSTRAAASASRCRALVAPAIEVRPTFAEALEQTSTGLPWVYRGRALLAYGRRLHQLGATDDAAALRREAAELFRHHGLSGWQRHAEELSCLDADGPRQQPRLHDRLDVTEIRIVRLVLSGRKNKEVASELYMSLRTLEKALTRIYRKLQVATKAEMSSVLTQDDVDGFSVGRSLTTVEPQARPHPAPFPPGAEPHPTMAPTAPSGSLTSSA